VRWLWASFFVLNVLGVCLGCDELGNPETGAVVEEYGVRLSSQMRTLPARRASEWVASLPRDAIEYSDGRLEIGGYVALVRVRITGVAQPPGAHLLLETLFRLEDGRRVVRRWPIDTARVSHLALFALPSRPLQMVTHLAKP